jgi:hypothetical protein
METDIPNDDNKRVTQLVVVALLVSWLMRTGRQVFEAPNSILSPIIEGGWPASFQMMTVMLLWRVPLYADRVVVVAVLPTNMTING